MVNSLCYQLCSANYTALQMKNSMRSISAVNLFATEIQAISITPNTATGMLHHATVNQHLVLSAKRIGTQRKQRQVHVACIVHIAVGKKAHLRTK